MKARTIIETDDADQKCLDRLRSDRDFREAVRSFLTSADECTARSQKEISAAFAELPRGGFRMIDGLCFNVSDNLRATETQVTRRAQEILGARLGDERDVSQSLWRAAVKVLQDIQDDDERIKFVISDISASINQTFQYIAPNHLFVLQEGVKRVDIGPVSIIKTSIIVNELAKTRPGEKWRLVVGDDPGVDDTGEVLLFRRPELSWIICLRSSKNNLTEEATWNADVATSLIRMAGIDLGVMIPRLGEQETRPFDKPVFRDEMIAYSETQTVSAGGRKLGYYEISPKTAKSLRKWVARTAPHVFYGARGSLGGQVARGLGWLSRARRTADRAERFLLFFTALEALISRPQANPQLTDNLARMTSVIWTNGSDERSTYYRTFKSLYDKRSKLVHQGIRDISTRDVNTIQLVSEQIFFVTLDKVPLDQPLAAFHGGLEAASFGGRWPPPKTK